MASGRGNKCVADLLQLPGNDRCADCGRPDPLFASHNLGIFICESCAGIHNSLGSHISKVKSVKLATWEDDHLNFMKENGNDVAKAKYEKNVPACYKRPAPTDPQVLKDQWIRAKYERHEFTGDEASLGGGIKVKQPYLSGRREGYLWKRGRENKHFQKRRFVLDAADNSLKYYNKEGVDGPKASIRLDDMNVTLVPVKVGNPNAMQITYDADGKMRNLFVYADNAQDTVEWYTAIRSAKLNRLAIAYPCATIEELCSMITRDFVKEGWLSKTGPRSGDAFRRRWVTLDKRKLYYYEDPLDAYPKGVVHVGTKGFEAKLGFGPGVKDPGYGFMLKTPDRNYQFSADNEDESKEWVKVLNQVINDNTI